MIVNLQSRNLQGELMDDPQLMPALFLGSLKGLRRLNRVTWSARMVGALLEGAARRPRAAPLRVLDVACGGGDLLIGLSQRFRRLGLAANFQGCDLNPLAVRHATEQAERKSAQVRFFPLNVITEPLPTDYDVVLNSLFLHHLDNQEAETFLRKSARAAREQVIVHDLVRSRAGYLLAYLGVRALLCNAVCRQDGPRSVEAAFTIPEVSGMAKSAGLLGCSVQPRFPFRFLLHWSKL